MAAGLICAAAGFLLLLLTSESSSYLELLPALLLWGIGLGVLPPAVVAAALGAVPADHSGLASAVNNTSRQAAGAIGIAGFGALAGPATGNGFMRGFHTGSLIAAALFVLAAAATLVLVGDSRRGAGG
jgi:DHA2 family methylenomycin A resistance protein-like MFS transporter